VGDLTWWLGVRCTYDHATGAISADQEACVIVAVYAKLVGELLYICINTVPEIMYALSALTRYMTRATSQHYGYDKQVLRYLKGVKHLKLT
jgi:hypothetical protein